MGRSLCGWKSGARNPSITKLTTCKLHEKGTEKTAKSPLTVPCMCPSQEKRFKVTQWAETENSKTWAYQQPETRAVSGHGKEEGTAPYPDPIETPNKHCSPREAGRDHEGTEPTETHPPRASGKLWWTYNVNHIITKLCVSLCQILKCEPMYFISVLTVKIILNKQCSNMYLTILKMDQRLLNCKVVKCEKIFL